MTVEITSCSVFTKPAEVDAGAEITLSAEVACSPAYDLRGRSLEIKDHTGALVGAIPFTGFGGTISETGETTIRAPKAPGTYTWFATIGAAADDTGPGDDLQAAEATSFIVTVSAHTTRLLVWGVAPAIEAGQRFSVNVGLKCSSGCDMTGRAFEVFDHTGDRIAGAALAGAIWPGSDGLFYHQLELEAPRQEGLHTWRIEVPAAEGEFPHQAATHTFNVRAVPAPEFTVRIEAVDKKNETPLSNMSVTMHPYRGTTDARGIAEVRVPRGTYSVYVSGPGYYPGQKEMKVTGDVTTRAPLEAEPPQPNYI